MAQFFSNLEVQLPSTKNDRNLEQKVNTLENQIYLLIEQLRYVLNNIEPENMNDAGLVELGDTIRQPIKIQIDDLEGNVTTIKATIDGLEITTEGGTTYISGDHIKSGTIEGVTLQGVNIKGSRFECILDETNTVIGDITFWDKRKGETELPMGRLAIIGDGENDVTIRLDAERDRSKLKIGANSDMSVTSIAGNVWVRAEEGQVTLEAASGVKIASPNRTRYEFKDDGIYYGGNKILST